MAFRGICVALLLSCLAVTGCGTVANLARQKPGEGGVSPFGGVRHDLSCVRQAANGDIGLKKHAKSESEQYPQFILMLFCAADLPFSFIGDLVTWPYTVTYSYINQPVPVPPVIVAPDEVPPLPPPPSP